MPHEFDKTGCDASLGVAFAQVPADVSIDYADVEGRVFTPTIGQFDAPLGCLEETPRARRVSEGVYMIDFESFFTSECISPEQRGTV